MDAFLSELFKQASPDEQRELAGIGRFLRSGGKRWTVDEVAEHVLDALMELRFALQASEQHVHALQFTGRTTD